MEIKRKGINPETWKKEVKCKYCEAEFTVSAQEISMVTRPKKTLRKKKIPATTNSKMP